MSDGALNRQSIVSFIADIFHRRGAEAYLGEAVTMSQHMLQAARLAEQAGADDALVAATLLHDIGHFVGEFPEALIERSINNYHDEAGASVLQPFFPEIVVQCVRQHVRAKRYLCATDKSYYDHLSAASVHTLDLQGGPMREAEVAAFRGICHLDAVIRVRWWDEAGKVAGAPTAPFEHYRPLLQRMVG